MEATVATRTSNFSILTLTVRMTYFNLMDDRFTISIYIFTATCECRLFNKIKHYWEKLFYP